MCESLEQEFNPEIEQAALLLWRLQIHKSDAMQFQQDLEDAHARAIQPMKIANYVTHFHEEIPQIPAKHHRLIFGPQYGSEAYPGIQRVIVRYPDTSDDFYPEPPIGYSWSDVFIEIVGDNNVRQNFLLNNKGFVAFDNAETDVVEDENFEETVDLFKVQTSTFPAVSVDLFTLSYLLSDPNRDESYVYQLQTKDIDPPVIQ